MNFLMNGWKARQLFWMAATVRLLFILASGKLFQTEYWEYGRIAEQLLAGHGYSFPFTDGQLQFQPHRYYPSALMPPGYVFFLIPFFLIKETLLRNLLLFSVQAALSLQAMQWVFRWSEKRFGTSAALLILGLQAFYPELIFACCTAGPTVIFHFLFAGILFYNTGRKAPLFSGLLAGMLVLMRSEALLPLVLLLLSDLIQGRKKYALTMAAVMAACLFPWLLRNQFQFGKPLLSASAGVNFFRGNNPVAIGNWPVFSDSEMEKMRQQPEKFEQKLDSAAMETVLRQRPSSLIFYVERGAEKLLRFWIIDWPDPRTHSFFYWFPWLLALPLGILGWRKGDFLPAEPLALLFLSYSLIVLFFFPQARYLTLIKFFWLIPAGLGLKALSGRISGSHNFLSPGE